jgi:hypothetical protein
MPVAGLPRARTPGTATRARSDCPQSRNAKPAVDAECVRVSVTPFDTHEGTWTGHLTFGRHCFYWSSADFGDAHLLDTGPCSTLEEAIAIFKQRIADLFDAFSGGAG